jgi:hypothetical protein
MLHLLLASLVTANRIVSITLAADNNWTMDITGHKTITGPADWYDVKTFNKTLTGPGPWIIAIKAVKAVETDAIAGFFASVSVDNVRLAVTGEPNTKWTVNAKSGAGWKTAPFDDSNWIHHLMPAEDCYDDIWGTVDVNFKDKLLANQAAATIVPIWYPNCKSKTKENYYRLKIPAVKDSK